METDEKYSVNPNAERILNGVATATLVLGWLLAIAAIIIGIVITTYGEGWEFLIGLLVGGILLLLFYIMWAELKVIINMSRSLYSINDAINNLGGADGSVTEEIIQCDDAGFKVGQLVIIKENEEQFRIDAIRKKGESYIYYSKKFDKSFMAEEIEDFEKYWAEKKKQ